MSNKPASALSDKQLSGGLGGVAKNKKYGSAAAQLHGFKGGIVTYIRYGEELYKRIRKKWWDSLSPKERAQRLKQMNKGLERARKNKKKRPAYNSL